MYFFKIFSTLCFFRLVFAVSKRVFKNCVSEFSLFRRGIAWNFYLAMFHWGTFFGEGDRRVNLRKHETSVGSVEKVKPPKCVCLKFVKICVHDFSASRRQRTALASSISTKMVAAAIVKVSSFMTMLYAGSLLVGHIDSDYFWPFNFLLCVPYVFRTSSDTEGQLFVRVFDHCGVM